MKLYIPNDDPRLPGEYVEVAEDRSAWTYTGLLAGLGLGLAGLIYVFI
jgi:hypothetical protein